MNPPSVYDVMTPSNHKTKRMMKIVQSISHLDGNQSRQLTITDGWTPERRRGLFRKPAESKTKGSAKQCAAKR